MFLPQSQSAPPLTGFQKIVSALQGLSSLENKPLEHLSKLAGAAPQLYAPAYAQAVATNADPVGQQYKQALTYRALNPQLDPAQAVSLQIEQLKLAQVQQQMNRQAGRAAVLSGGVNPVSAPPLNMGSGPLNVRNNNPGNMRGPDGNFANYSTPQEGLDAMTGDLALKINGQSPIMQSRYGEGYAPTLNNVISTWAPPSENDTQGYINFVAEKTGLNPDQPLTTADIQKLAPAMIQMEGGQEALNAYAPALQTETAIMPPSNVTAAISAPSVGFVPNPAIPQLQRVIDSGYATEDDYNTLLQLQGQEATRLQQFQESRRKEDPKPQTPVAQLEADYKNGFISKDDYDAGKLKYQKEAQEARDAVEKSKNTVSSQIAGAKNVLSSIDKSLKLAGSNVVGFNTSTGLTGQVLGAVGGTDAYDLRKSIDTIQASLSFDKLQEMRNNSPTGGALGSIAVRELDLLGATVASLDNAQSQEQVVENLKRVQEHYDRWLSAVDPDYKPASEFIDMSPQNQPTGGWGIRKK